MESDRTRTPLVIGISGAARSGKNTVADMIQAAAIQRGLTVTQFAFADRLKRVVAATFDWDLSSLYEGDRAAIDPVWGVSRREALTHIGTELFRNHLAEAMPMLQLHGRTFWVEVFAREYEKRLRQFDIVLVTDVRFEDEWGVLRDVTTQGGGSGTFRPAILWHVFRPGVSDVESVVTQHASEQFHRTIHVERRFDVQTVNDGTLDSLNERVSVALQTFL